MVEVLSPSAISLPIQSKSKGEGKSYWPVAFCHIIKFYLETQVSLLSSAGAIQLNCIHISLPRLMRGMMRTIGPCIELNFLDDGSMCQSLDSSKATFFAVFSTTNLHWCTFSCSFPSPAIDEEPSYQGTHNCEYNSDSNACFSAPT